MDEQNLLQDNPNLFHTSDTATMDVQSTPDDNANQSEDQKQEDEDNGNTQLLDVMQTGVYGLDPMTGSMIGGLSTSAESIESEKDEKLRELLENRDNGNMEDSTEFISESYLISEKKDTVVEFDKGPFDDFATLSNIGSRLEEKFDSGEISENLITPDEKPSKGEEISEEMTDPQISLDNQTDLDEERLFKSDETEEDQLGNQRDLMDQQNELSQLSQLEERDESEEASALYDAGQNECDTTELFQTRSLKESVQVEVQRTETSMLMTEERVDIVKREVEIVEKSDHDFQHQMASASASKILDDISEDESQVLRVDTDEFKELEQQPRVGTDDESFNDSQTSFKEECITEDLTAKIAQTQQSMDDRDLSSPILENYELSLEEEAHDTSDINDYAIEKQDVLIKSQTELSDIPEENLVKIERAEEEKPLQLDISTPQETVSSSCDQEIEAPADENVQSNIEIYTSNVDSTESAESVSVVTVQEDKPIEENEKSIFDDFNKKHVDESSNVSDEFVQLQEENRQLIVSKEESAISEELTMEKDSSEFPEEENNESVLKEEEIADKLEESFNSAEEKAFDSRDEEQNQKDFLAENISELEQEESTVDSSGIEENVSESNNSEFLKDQPQNFEQLSDLQTEDKMSESLYDEQIKETSHIHDVEEKEILKYELEEEEQIGYDLEQSEQVAEELSPTSYTEEERSTLNTSEADNQQELNQDEPQLDTTTNQEERGTALDVITTADINESEQLQDNIVERKELDDVVDEDNQTSLVSTEDPEESLDFKTHFDSEQSIHEDEDDVSKLSRQFSEEPQAIPPRFEEKTDISPSVLKSVYKSLDDEQSNLQENLIEQDSDEIVKDDSIASIKSEQISGDEGETGEHLVEMKKESENEDDKEKGKEESDIIADTEGNLDDSKKTNTEEQIDEKENVIDSQEAHFDDKHVTPEEVNVKECQELNLGDTPEEHVEEKQEMSLVEDQPVIFDDKPDEFILEKQTEAAIEESTEKSEEFVQENFEEKVEEACEILEREEVEEQLEELEKITEEKDTEQEEEKLKESTKELPLETVVEKAQEDFDVEINSADKQSDLVVDSESDRFDEENTTSTENLLLGEMNDPEIDSVKIQNLQSINSDNLIEDKNEPDIPINSGGTNDESDDEDASLREQIGGSITKDDTLTDIVGVTDEKIETHAQSRMQTESDETFVGSMQSAPGAEDVTGVDEKLPIDEEKHYTTTSDEIIKEDDILLMEQTSVQNSAPVSDDQALLDMEEKTELETNESDANVSTDAKTNIVEMPPDLMEECGTTVEMKTEKAMDVSYSENDNSGENLLDNSYKFEENQTVENIIVEEDVKTEVEIEQAVHEAVDEAIEEVKETMTVEITEELNAAISAAEEQGESNDKVDELLIIEDDETSNRFASSTETIKMADSYQELSNQTETEIITAAEPVEVINEVNSATNEMEESFHRVETTTNESVIITTSSTVNESVNITESNFSKEITVEKTNGEEFFEKKTVLPSTPPSSPIKVEQTLASGEVSPLDGIIDKKHVTLTHSFNAEDFSEDLKPKVTLSPDGDDLFVETSAAAVTVTSVTKTVQESVPKPVQSPVASEKSDSSTKSSSSAKKVQFTRKMETSTSNIATKAKSKPPPSPKTSSKPPIKPVSAVAPKPKVTPKPTPRPTTKPTLLATKPKTSPIKPKSAPVLSSPVKSSPKKPVQKEVKPVSKAKPVKSSPIKYASSSVSGNGNMHKSLDKKRQRSPSPQKALESTRGRSRKEAYDAQVQMVERLYYRAIAISPHHKTGNPITGIGMKSTDEVRDSILAASLGARSRNKNPLTGEGYDIENSTQLGKARSKSCVAITRQRNLTEAGECREEIKARYTRRENPITANTYDSFTDKQSLNSYGHENIRPERREVVNTIPKGERSLSTPRKRVRSPTPARTNPITGEGYDELVQPLSLPKSFSHHGGMSGILNSTRPNPITMRGYEIELQRGKRRYDAAPSSSPFAISTDETF